MNQKISTLVQLTIIVATVSSTSTTTATTTKLRTTSITQPTTSFKTNHTTDPTDDIFESTNQILNDVTINQSTVTNHTAGPTDEYTDQRSPIYDIFESTNQILNDVTINQSTTTNHTADPPNEYTNLEYTNQLLDDASINQSIPTKIEYTDQHETPPTTNVSHLLKRFCETFNISLERCSCNKTHQVCIAENIFSSKLIHNTTPSTEYRRLHKITFVYSTVAILASIVGVIGNIIVLGTAYENNWHKSSPCKLHVAELACVNLLFSVVQIINTVPLYWTNTWLYSECMCKIIRSTLEGGNFMSIGLIQIIALERYYLIAYPFQNHTYKGRFRHTLVITNIIIVFGTLIPYILALHVDNESGRCIIRNGDNYSMVHTYNWFVIVFYSILPICMISIVTSQMIRQLVDASNIKTSLYNERTRLKIVKRNRRIMAITLIILLTFILCALPSRIITVLIEGKTSHMTISPDMYIILTLVSYLTYPLQSVLNPILYSMTAVKWRRDRLRKSSSLGLILNNKETNL